MVSVRASLVPASLRYVDQVARSGSIQKASRELNIAASAIDRQILLLESDLGAQLFERLPRGMRLTAAGDVLVALARRWRGDERRVAAEIQQLHGIDQGQVRLAAMDSHVNGFLPGLVERLADEHPHVALEVEIVSPDAALTALLSGGADIAAIFNLPPRRDITALWSVELPFGCVMSPDHPLAQSETVSLQEAVAGRIALQSRSLQIRRYLDARYGWLFTDPHRAVVTNSLQLVKQLAAGGRYVAFTSELDAAPEIARRTLVFRAVRDKGVDPQTVSIAIDTRKALSRVGRIVADMIKEEITDALANARHERGDGQAVRPS